MLGDNAKKIATVIISRMKEQDGPRDYGSDEKESDDMDMDTAMTAAAKGVLSAIKSEDPGLVKDALKEFFLCCSHEKEALYGNSEVGE